MTRSILTITLLFYFIHALSQDIVSNSINFESNRYEISHSNKEKLKALVINNRQFF